MSMIRLRVVLAVVAVCAVLALGGFGGSGGSDGSKSKAEVQRFLNELDKAVREGNTDFRVGRLHTAVIERYGEQQCRDFLAAQVDKTRRDRVKRVAKPEAFEFDTDNLSVTIPDAMTVAVRETRMGKKADRNLHLARVNKELTYFVDCGQPLVRQ
jgi:hypothetical protein